MKRLGTESAFAVLAQAQALERTGRKVVHLEIGEPDFPTPAHIVQAAEEGLRAGHTHYVASAGTLRLREAVSAFLERTGRLRTTPDPHAVAAKIRFDDRRSLNCIWPVNDRRHEPWIVGFRALKTSLAPPCEQLRGR